MIQLMAMVKNSVWRTSSSPDTLNTAVRETAYECRPLQTDSTTENPKTSVSSFSRYQKFVVAILTVLQFAVILDFMLMAPLGALIMPALQIGPKAFALIVSAYAFSAGAASLLTAGFADRFDRKALLLFFYSGFVLGTLWCGLAQSFESLLVARIVTGLFGGVIGSIVQAIAADLFPLSIRGQVMGSIQTAFSASQVLGLPAGLYLSQRWNWHVPFIGLTALGLIGGIVLARRMQPITGHLEHRETRSPWGHLLHTFTIPQHALAFATTALLTTGGFMLMPFSTAYAVNNLGIRMEDLPTVYLVTGLCTILIGPFIGKASDTFGPRMVFTVGSLITIAMVLIYTQLGHTPLVALIAVNTIMFIGIFSRMIPFQAISSSVPTRTQRGAYAAISAAIQQLSGGIASVAAGHIVTLRSDGQLQHFQDLGYVVAGTSLIAFGLLHTLVRSAPATQGNRSDTDTLTDTRS